MHKSVKMPVCSVTCLHYSVQGDLCSVASGQQGRLCIYREIDLEKRCKDEMVLPIEANIPLPPPPSGSCCNPKASSMMASNASPAFNTRLWSSDDQSQPW